MKTTLKGFEKTINLLGEEIGYKTFVLKDYKKMNKKQRKILEEYYKQLVEAQERYETEKRKHNIKKVLEWEKERFLFGK